MKQLLALNGKLACGKTTVSQELIYQYNFQIISIGTTIKKASNLLVENIDELRSYMLEVLKDESLTSELYEELINGFNSYFASAKWKKEKNGNYVKNQSYRDLTQFIASTFREKLGEDIWVKFLATDAINLVNKGKRVVCDDLRYPSEKKIFEEFGFKTIRFDVSKEAQKERIKARGDGEISEEALNHPSETALDNATFDLRFDTSKLNKEEMQKVVIDYIFED